MSHFVGDVIQCSLEQDHMEGVEEHEWVGISFVMFYIFVYIFVKIAIYLLLIA